MDGVLNVHYSARQFYFISKIFGTFSYQYDGSYLKGVLKQSFFGVFWCLISSGILIAVLVTNIVTGDSITSSSKILASAWHWSLNLSLASIAFAKAYQLYRHQSIVKFLEIIEVFEQKVSD